MTKRELYVQFATSTAEEFAARWLPFRFLPLAGILQTQNWTCIIIAGILFGVLHLVKDIIDIQKTTKDPIHRPFKKYYYIELTIKTILLIGAGIGLNWVYVIVLSDPLNFPVVIVIHFAARMIGAWWQRR